MVGLEVCDLDQNVRPSALSAACNFRALRLLLLSIGRFNQVYWKLAELLRIRLVATEASTSPPECKDEDWKLQIELQMDWKP